MLLLANSFSMLKATNNADDWGQQQPCFPC
jgi:hypothetical protein